MTSCRSEPDLQTRWQNDLQNVTEKCSQVPPPGCGDPHASETRMHTRRIRGEWDWNILTTFDNWNFRLFSTRWSIFIYIYAYLILYLHYVMSCHCDIYAKAKDFNVPSLNTGVSPAFMRNASCSSCVSGGRTRQMVRRPPRPPGTREVSWLR